MNNNISHNDFFSNIEYILNQLEKNIDEVNILEDKMYFDLTKNELINYISAVYFKVKEWKCYYENHKYDLIISEYNEIESIISELEFCLADLENTFHMNGISYSLFQIGKILLNIDKNIN